MATPICVSCPLLEVHERKLSQDASDWSNESISVENYQKKNPVASSVTVICAQADKIRECSACRKSFEDIFKIPDLWWSNWCKRSNGYFGVEDTTDAQGQVDGHNTWFRFLIKHTLKGLPKDKKDYLWYKFNIFTRFLPATKQNIILIFDPRPEIKKRIPSGIFSSLDLCHVSDPYWIHTLFAEEVVELQDNAVWAIRDLVRDMEKNRTTPAAPNPDYPRFHDTARHAIHVTETIELAVKTVEYMKTQHMHFSTERPPPDEAAKLARSRIRKRMDFHHHMLESLQSRAASNKERLLNEIQLAFNTVAQYDSRISVEVGRAAQVDSSAMKTIAFLTLTFFPATFVSAIFSMAFFNYDADNDRFRVSKQFWLYWVVAIPITVITGGYGSFGINCFRRSCLGRRCCSQGGIIWRRWR
ncbi:hypothetical protein B0J14DRAFT_132248 [Halenospora varia]|nr:hypothetical protein B0J14DRAFT_132248 [Halenospora varia]